MHRIGTGLLVLFLARVSSAAVFETQALTLPALTIGSPVLFGTLISWLSSSPESTEWAGVALPAVLRQFSPAHLEGALEIAASLENQTPVVVHSPTSPNVVHVEIHSQMTGWDQRAIPLNRHPSGVLSLARGSHVFDPSDEYLFLLLERLRNGAQYHTTGHYPTREHNGRLHGVADFMTPSPLTDRHLAREALNDFLDLKLAIKNILLTNMNPFVMSPGQSLTVPTVIAEHIPQLSNRELAQEGFALFNTPWPQNRRHLSLDYLYHDIQKERLSTLVDLIRRILALTPLLLSEEIRYRLAWSLQELIGAKEVDNKDKKPVRVFVKNLGAYSVAMVLSMNSLIREISFHEILNSLSLRDAENLLAGPSSVDHDTLLTHGIGVFRFNVRETRRAA